MSDAGKAVFLSYASQDAEEARRIAEAPRTAGVEVWFDQNERGGGDAWDARDACGFEFGVLDLELSSGASRAWPLLQRTPRSNMLTLLFYSPVFGSVRDDPRFQQLLTKLGCAEENKVGRETLARITKQALSSP